MRLFLASPFNEIWDDPFTDAFAIKGEIYRDMGNRHTSRFEVGERGYFIKTHTGVGLSEILKNLLCLRLPVLGATNEYRAINRLHDIGLDTMQVAGFGCTGLNPTTQRSFLVTVALEPTEALDEFLSPEKLRAMGVRNRRALIRKLAEISRVMHYHGLNHRDYYLCHFLLDTRPQYQQTPLHERPIYLIDLHRMQIRKRTPDRWRRKDLAGLLYSARMVGFDRRDALAFVRQYDGRPLADSLKHPRFWQDILQDADKLRTKGQRKGYHG